MLFVSAWVGSIDFGCILVFAPLSGALSHKYGCRIVAVMGLVIASTFLFVSSFAERIVFLYFSYGLMFGLGSSLAYTQGLVMVSQYFR